MTQTFSRLRRDVSHDVYRCFDSAGQLLYVGVTNSYPQRMSHHRSRTAWWQSVAEIRRETYPDREQALDAETAAIARENPLHNTRGTLKPDAKVHRPRPTPWLFERLQLALMVGGFLLLPIAIWWPL